MNKFFKKDSIIYYIFLLYFLIGLLIYKDFGVGIEEHFQRSSGFYWLNYVLQFTDFEFIKNEVNFKISEINNLHPNLPPVEIAQHYGVIFDLPMAFIEIIFKIDVSSDQFYLRHLINFIIFFISSSLFYFFIKKRTRITSVAIISFLFYLISPRIFGNSFFDGKDLLFLSIVTITFYFYSKYCEKKNLLNLFLFALFSAISTSTRIMGLFFPISFLLIGIFQFLNPNIRENILKDLGKYFFLFIICLFVHWPYLWTIEISQYLNFFQVFKVGSNPEVFFNGYFYNSQYLPLKYIPYWMIISIPEIIILTFLVGIIFYIRRLFNRFILLNEKFYQNDLWRGNFERIDLFVLISLFQIIVVYLSFNLSLYSGWRHFLFLNFFITYFACLGVYFFIIKYKNNIKLKTLFFSFVYICILNIIYDIYKYHPFQSVYFNNLVTDQMKRKFEVDTQSLSRTMAIKDILKDAKKKNRVVIATASWTPLENGRSLISTQNKERLIFIGTDNKQSADYIYSNFYYEVNPKYEEKYKIPSNFKLLKSHSVDNTLIYSIFKKIQ